MFLAKSVYLFQYLKFTNTGTVCTQDLVTDRTAKASEAFGRLHANEWVLCGNDLDKTLHVFT